MSYSSKCKIAQITNYIDGKFYTTEDYIDSFDPSTGELVAKVPNSDKNDIDKAVKAAKLAFKGWSEKTTADRAKVLHRIADILESKKAEFVEAESKDQGKPLWLANAVDIPRCILNFRHFATSAQSDSDKAVHEPEKDVINYTIHAPIGVVGIIVPWNLPLYLLTFKLAPALIYGNTVVAKPSEFTSITAWKLCSILEEAGVPNGVVNMVFGYGHTAGESLVTHPEVPVISFTGSTKTGTHIAEVTASMAKKVSLEMGGKNAAIVFDDVNMDKCIPELIKASFINSGQVCLSTSRIYIQDSIFDKFKEKFISAVKKIKIGSPTSSDTWLGPLNSKQHWEKVKRYLNLAKQEGATFVCGNDILNLPEENKRGYFVAPTVLSNLSDNSRCMQEEIFGPVTCIEPFSSEDEVISRTNNVQYGLCASLWSQNLGRIHRIAPKLEVGTVWCNCWLQRNLHMPFGGVKMSGLGREGTEDSKDFYTEKKTICIMYS